METKHTNYLTVAAPLTFNAIMSYERDYGTTVYCYDVADMDLVTLEEASNKFTELEATIPDPAQRRLLVESWKEDENAFRIARTLRDEIIKTFSKAENQSYPILGYRSIFGYNTTFDHPTINFVTSNNSIYLIYNRLDGFYPEWDIAISSYLANQRKSNEISNMHYGRKPLIEMTKDELARYIALQTNNYIKAVGPLAEYKRIEYLLNVPESLSQYEERQRMYCQVPIILVDRKLSQPVDLINTFVDKPYKSFDDALNMNGEDNLSDILDFYLDPDPIRFADIALYEIDDDPDMIDPTEDCALLVDAEVSKEDFLYLADTLFLNQHVDPGIHVMNKLSYLNDVYCEKWNAEHMVKTSEGFPVHWNTVTLGMHFKTPQDLAATLCDTGKENIENKFWAK